MASKKPKRKLHYPRKWSWPGGAKICVSLNMALESFVRASQVTLEKTSNKVDHFSLTYADYAYKSGVWRLMDLMDELKIKGSCSTNGLTGERHPDVVRQLADYGVEIVGHAWAQDVTMKDDDPQTELEEMRKVTRVLTEAAGTRPVGWVSQGSAMTGNTLELLKQEGYLWSGDDMSDDIPFLKETKHGPMVILPRVNLPHNDLWMWATTRTPPEFMWQNWKATFDQLYAEGEAGYPKWCELTMHAHMGARPTLIPVARQMLQYAKKHKGVWFARRRDIAEWAMKHETK
jgi:peptidoglycan/xylan/chitin deacetylase (PgdA/CDA1 family)